MNCYWWHKHIWTWHIDMSKTRWTQHMFFNYLHFLNQYYYTKSCESCLVLYLIWIQFLLNLSFEFSFPLVHTSLHNRLGYKGLYITKVLNASDPNLLLDKQAYSYKITWSSFRTIFFPFVVIVNVYIYVHMFIFLFGSILWEQ